MNTACLLFQCSPNSRFHFGTNGVHTSDSILHSDTLLAALLNAYALAFGDAQDVVEYMKQGRLRFSSAFPCVHNSNTQQYIFFFPLPPLQYNLSMDVSERKKLQNRRFVSTQVLLDIVQSKITWDTERELHCSPQNLLTYSSLQAEFIYASSEMEQEFSDSSFLIKETLPKVQVDTAREEQETNNLYHETFVRFTPLELDEETVLSGHYFTLLQHTLTPEEWNKIVTAFRIAAHQGFGGRRSTGAGQCADVVELSAPQLPVVDTPSLWLGLSLFSPNSEQELSSVAACSLVTRGGGRMGSSPTTRKLGVRMVAEGALLQKEARGHLVDISPIDNPMPHLIFCNGINFCIPIQ